ncbi:MAG: hypothetical protein Q9191_000681 [Dirinaria sp. TL-2023a]
MAIAALFLPEASDYIGSSAAETVSLACPVTKSEFILGLQKEAKREHLPINVGIHEPAEGGKKVKNTLIWINGEGEISQSMSVRSGLISVRYQKLHLFDVDIKDGPVLKESNNVEAGMEVVPPFETVLGRVGLMICFDLRFPETSLALKRQDAQIITYPSAFTVHTGKAHWEPLLRARAVETQSYVVAAAQVGAHNEKRVSYGHSMIVSPWGEVVAKLGGDSGEPEIATADIDLDLVKKIKREMPLLRRTWVAMALMFFLVWRKLMVCSDIYPEV